MSAKAPSEGTKVTAGKNAPITSEGPGAVASDSLAAESQAFQQANEAEPQIFPHENLTAASSKPHEGSTTAESSTSGSHAGSTAPSYAQNIYHQDPKGPHGKNIKEDESIATEDKNRNASFSEFGTKNDPAAAAERKFALADAVPAASSGGRQKHIEGQTTFEALESEEEA
ncbi:hypothetical protein F4779DRAFT_604258 [Xylariaceae sp. FL0662B]|nr:hypothetical protein F4779DRAFT_604258 [Xylariaceae sp. FL0662B]